MSDKYLDELDEGLDELDEEFEDEVELAATIESDGLDDDQREAEARRAAVAEADGVLAEAHGLSDEPGVGPGDAEHLRKWGEWLEKSLAERAYERAQIQAVFDAEDAAALAGAVEAPPGDPIDFRAWPRDDFNDLMRRVTGKVPLNAARRPVDDELFMRGLALTGEG